VVPVDAIAGKAEYGARTIRPKLMRAIDDYVAAIARLARDAAEAGA
jgi:hypothetical protein